MFAEDEARLLVQAARSPVELAEMVDRRVAGFPLEHILGWVEFCGLRFVVHPGVFVPRQRTAFMVDEAASRARTGAVVLDLCCGCGALGGALLARIGGVTLHASDLDPAATACARLNLASAEAHVYEGDLFDPLPDALQGTIDILLCNTPYVPSGEIDLLPPEARLHEPLATLDGGLDGLDVQRRVAAEACKWLAPGGHVFFETSQRQAPAAAALLESEGLTAVVARSQELDATVVIGRL